jgi:vacuolar-type H+-ATPase subunit F/Vma7
MMQRKKLDIAIIGEGDQVALMRLAGIEKYEVIEDGQHLHENVRVAFRGFMEDPSIGIIVMPENWTDYVDDLRKEILKRKKITPVIIEIPSRFQREKQDVRRFYQSYTKRLLGFMIEI